MVLISTPARRRWVAVAVANGMGAYPLVASAGCHASPIASAMSKKSLAGVYGGPAQCCANTFG